MKNVYFNSFLLSIFLLGIYGCSDTSVTSTDENLSIEEVFTPVIVSLYDPTPPVLGSDDKYHLIYGLLLTNTRNLPAAVEKIEVFNENERSSPILTLQGNEILPYLHHLDSQVPENLKIERDAARILFISLAFDDADSIPRGIIHRISVRTSANPSLISYDGGHFQVSTQTPPVISPPLEGKGWLAINSCCSFAGVHQATIIPINGVLYNSQRFAVDFMKLDDQNSLVQGDSSIPSNWICYNEKIFAVADGTIVSVLDGLPDQPPGTMPDPKTINIKNITGNHVILKVKEGVYVFYAHLRNGSIKVKVGDHVKNGDHIAHVGNSGNTSAPHLHIHLMSTISPVGSTPVPYTIDAFKAVGTISEESFYGEEENLQNPFEIQITSTAQRRQKQFPMDMTVFEFDK